MLKHIVHALRSSRCIITARVQSPHVQRVIPARWGPKGASRDFLRHARPVDPLRQLPEASQAPLSPVGDVVGVSGCLRLLRHNGLVRSAHSYQPFLEQHQDFPRFPAYSLKPRARLSTDGHEDGFGKHKRDMPAHALPWVEHPHVWLEPRPLPEHLKRHRLVNVDGDRVPDDKALPRPVELCVGVLEGLIDGKEEVIALAVPGERRARHVGVEGGGSGEIWPAY